VQFHIRGVFVGGRPRVDLAASLLSGLAAGSLFVLFGTTWPLWSPQDEFPRVPFVGWLVGIPAWLEWAALGGCGIALLIALIFATKVHVMRWAVVVSTLAIAVLVLADQHRFQPWVYQLVVLQIVLAALPASEAISLARMFVISIYLFSALSKLDRSFFDAGGGQIVEGLLRCLGLADRVNVDARTLLAGGVAAAELLVAVGLFWRRSRKLGWPASIVMHLLLLAALGPWGENSQPGVLLWNVYFILQNVILFGLAGELRTADSAARVFSTDGSRSEWPRRAVCCLVAFVILFPLTEPFGLCDVWPAWAVYATEPERLRVFVNAADRDHLPPSIGRYLQEPRFEDDLCLVRIDRWSLDACRAPLYPQNRFRLGVALAIADKGALGDRILVELDGAANRFTGERTSRQLKGRAAIVSELDGYWLNGFPRKNGN
jgi:hypothetical protein